MFSLIITIIAIALVALLAIATIMYGGTAMQKGGSQAKATRILNEGQQMKGALTLYRADTGDTASSLDDLVSATYLKTVPQGWDVGDGFTFHVESDYNVCLAANQKIGVDTVPTCADSNYATQAVCCSSPN